VRISAAASSRCSARATWGAHRRRVLPADARSADGLIARACERVQGRNVSGTPSSDDIRCGPEMRHVHLLAKRAAVSNINVLIVGETGVGKEVLARSSTGLSPRAQKAFVRINCATLSSTLFESELFGHERAAFTDAREAKPGLLETAEGGRCCSTRSASCRCRCRPSCCA
jgi:transcriptional regulator with PAS, ATPase and Fis domain